MSFNPLHTFRRQASILALPLLREAGAYAAAPYGGLAALHAAVLASARGAPSSGSNSIGRMAWWWEPVTARRCLRAAWDHLLAALARRRSGGIPALSFADVADFLGTIEAATAAPGAIGILPVAFIELSHAFGEALFALRTRDFKTAQLSTTKLADLYLGEISVTLPVGPDIGGSGDSRGAVSALSRSPARTCYVGIVLAGLAADQAARLLLRGGANSVSCFPAALAHLGAARADYFLLRGDSSAPTPLGRLYVGTPGDVLFCEATEAIDVELAPLAVEIAEHRVPLRVLRELSVPTSWQSFRGVMTAWGLGDSLGGDGDGPTSGHVSSMVRDLEGTLASLRELRVVGRFLRDAALASPPLVQLLEQAAAEEEAAPAGLSLTDAQQATAALKASLADVPPVALLALRVFCGQPGSHMFRAFFHGLAAESMRESRSMSGASARVTSVPPVPGVEWRGHIRAGDIALKAATHLEGLILDGNVLISTFASMSSAIERALQGLTGQRVEDELQLIRVFVAARRAFDSGALNTSTSLLVTYSNEATAVDDDAAAGGVARVMATAELLHYRRAYEPLVATITSLELVPEMVSRELKTAAADAMTLDFPLLDAADQLAEARRVLAGLTPAQADFIAELQRCAGLVAFLAGFEALGPGAFDDQAALITAQMQGRAYETGVINQLIAARSWLGPLFARPAPHFPDLPAVVSHLSSVATAAGDIAAAALVIRGLAEHTEEIRSWFSVERSGALAVLSRVESFGTRARFVSLLRAAPGGERLILESDAAGSQMPGDPAASISVVSPAALTEMVRGAVLSRVDAESAEHRDALDRFVAAHYAAAEAHAVRLRLEATFHPDFSAGSPGTREELRVEVRLAGGVVVWLGDAVLDGADAVLDGADAFLDGADATLLPFFLQGAVLATRCQTLQAAFSAWATVTEKAMVRCRRLRLLSSAQLLAFMRVCCDGACDKLLPFIVLW